MNPIQFASRRILFSSPLVFTAKHCRIPSGCTTLSQRYFHMAGRRTELLSVPLQHRQSFESKTTGVLVLRVSRAYAKATWSPRKQQQQQQEAPRNALTSLYLTRKHYVMIGALVFVCICIGIHYFFPDHSLIDYVLKYAYYGGPYRDYVLLKRGVFLDNDGTMVYIPNEMHFEIAIPDHFVHPGLVLTEDTTYKTKGWFSMTDPLEQNLLVEWKEIMQQLNDNEQTRFTPIDEILKACAYMHVKELNDTLGKDNVHVQRCEYLSMQKRDLLLDELPFDHEKEPFGNMVCLVNKISNPYKKNDTWEGDLWFMHSPYIFHLRLTYPSNLSQLASPEHDPAETLHAYAKRISSDPQFQSQIEQKVALTQEPKQISKTLRDQLVLMYMKNKFKRHGTISQTRLPTTKDSQEAKDSDEKKKGWFW